MSYKSRHAHIKNQLAFLEREHIISDWMLYSPDGQAKRWVISGPGLSLSLPTIEIETWLSGALTVYGKLTETPIT